MISCCRRLAAGFACILACIATFILSLCVSLDAQAPAQSSSSSSSSTKHTKASAAAANSGIDAGSVTNGVYRNKTLGLICKVPAGWVLRTEEMNTQDSGQEANIDPTEAVTEKDQTAHPVAKGATTMGHPLSGGRVLLAAFSRPPEARGDDVNASILIAVESAATYPGLKDAAQYFGPITEVAKAQGFAVDEEPYEYAVGTKTLVRGDFHKDVGTRVMRQSTLAILAHGYAVSITMIGGTEDQLEELIDGMSFGK
jgi:hypothetical protein